MPRRPATVTQADVARAIRAAKQTGAGTVLIRPDGTIEISIERSQGEPIDRDREVVL